MATESEIIRDIEQIYAKIDQCNVSIEDLQKQISREYEDITGLGIFMKQDEERVASGKKPRYDAIAMQNNVQRLHNNIELFRTTIKKEEDTIKKFREMIKVLQADMARPKEIVINLGNK